MTDPKVVNGRLALRELARRGLVWASVVAFGIAAAASLRNGTPDWVAFAGFPVVGAIILTSRPGHGVGRFLAVIGLYWTLTGWLTDSLIAGLPSWAESMLTALPWLGWMVLPLIGLVFPTGRIETRLGRVVAAFLVLLALLSSGIALVAPPVLPSGRRNPFGLSFAATGAELLAGPALLLPFLGLVLAVLADLLLRWRASSGARRLQYRWFWFGLAAAVVAVSVSGAGNAYLPNSLIAELVTVVGALGTNLVPVSIAIAITRHGLYEIGRVVSRTVTYAVVTAAAIGSYAVVVTAVSQVFPAQSSLAVAAATLVAAGVLLPVLRRVQRVVDRRFDRERYDAAQVVDAFGARLRTAVEPDRTAGDLVRAAEQTLQPSGIGLWLGERS